MFITEHKIYHNPITTIFITDHVLPILNERISESRESVGIRECGTWSGIYNRSKLLPLRLRPLPLPFPLGARGGLPLLWEPELEPELDPNPEPEPEPEPKLLDFCIFL
ncbi:hypothetical protein M9H77_22649 [Catharanthus roseus]|uniref:Uncharacterized protein n=1 Tax=Catharanthus roseus TaxID=4058 RepID=A0ACC0ARG8_CATRO|nr:hypothetical protein M9H77_22649 [Catharanthus roseus]